MGKGLDIVSINRELLKIKKIHDIALDILESGIGHLENKGKSNSKKFKGANSFNVSNRTDLEPGLPTTAWTAFHYLYSASVLKLSRKILISDVNEISTE